jgi:hypothetical protein
MVPSAREMAVKRLAAECCLRREGAVSTCVPARLGGAALELAATERRPRERARESLVDRVRRDAGLCDVQDAGRLLPGVPALGADLLAHGLFLASIMSRGCASVPFEPS